MTIQTSQPAPEFKLFNSDKKQIALADYKGQNVVLLFFPFAYSDTCTEELCTVRDSFEQYQTLDAVVLGISTDSVFTLAQYKRDNNLSFDLLSDYNKEVSEAYGVLYPSWGFEYRGVTKRSVFVLDSEGIVQYSEVLENAGELPNMSAILEALSSIEA